MLVGYKLTSPQDMERAAKELLAMGKSRAVLVKGGHALGEEGGQAEEGEAGAVAQDYLLDRETGRGIWISSPRYVVVKLRCSALVGNAHVATGMFIHVASPPQPQSQARQRQHARDRLHALLLRRRLPRAGAPAARRGGAGQGLRQPGHPRGRPARGGAWARAPDGLAGQRA